VLDGDVFSGDRFSGDSVVAYSGTYVAEPMTGMPTDLVTTGEQETPLIVLPDNGESRALLLGDQAGALVALEVAEERGWPLAAGGYLVDREDGLTEAQAERVRERLENADLYVERGFVDTLQTFLIVLVGGVSFLLLVVTLTSTALSLSEQRRDDATLAAVGATRRTRRSIAAAQAVITAGVGAVLGLVVGLVPGITFAYPLTRSTGPDGQQIGPFVTVPYAWLAVVVLGVPAVAALLAAVAVRRAPEVTRRTG
jgi:putative ABC transport system permease protein